MDQQRAREMAQEIESAVSSNDAKTKLEYDPDRGYILTGNRAGLLRFAAEVLGAASDAGGRVDATYLAELGTEPVVHIGLAEMPKPPQSMASWKQKAIGMSIFGVLVIGVICAVIGLITVIRFFVR